MSWKVLVTARTINDVGHTAVALMREAGCTLTIPEKLGPYGGDELIVCVEGHDAILATMDRFTPEVLESPRLASLKVISRWGVGYDAIHVPTATRQGIVVAFTPGLLNETVADYTWALLLALARRIPEGHQLMRAGDWKIIWGVDVHEKTLGLLGCGRIGQAVARRAVGFNMRVLAHDPQPQPEAERLGVRFVSMDELLEQSDFLSLHSALTPANRGLMGEPQLRRMKRGACLINTARGALVDEAALGRALEEGWIAGAAVDAFVVEPLPPDHSLRRARNLVLTPHQASFGRETGERVSLAAAQAIVDLMQGRRPRWVVDPLVFDAPRLRVRLGARGV